MNRDLDKAEQRQDEQSQLKLQRRLSYRRALEDDEWVDRFFNDIEKSIDPTPFELLKQHISDSAEYLMYEEEKRWKDQHNGVFQDFFIPFAISYYFVFINSFTFSSKIEFYQRIYN